MSISVNRDSAELLRVIPQREDALANEIRKVDLALNPILKAKPEQVMGQRFRLDYSVHVSSTSTQKLWAWFIVPPSGPESRPRKSNVAAQEETDTSRVSGLACRRRKSANR
jgi:hypothetical protein